MDRKEVTESLAQQISAIDGFLRSGPRGAAYRILSLSDQLVDGRFHETAGWLDEQCPERGHLYAARCGLVVDAIRRRRETDCHDYDPGDLIESLRMHAQFLQGLHDEVCDGLLSRDSESGNKGVSYKSVRDVLLRWCDEGKPFTSYDNYQTHFRCSRATVHKAIHSCNVLPGWMKRATDPAAKATAMSDVVLDNAAQAREPDPAEAVADCDSQLSRLIAEQAADDARPVVHKTV